MTLEASLGARLPKGCPVRPRCQNLALRESHGIQNWLHETVLQACPKAVLACGACQAWGRTCVVHEDIEREAKVQGPVRPVPHTLQVRQVEDGYLQLGIGELGPAAASQRRCVLVCGMLALFNLGASWPAQN